MSAMSLWMIPFFVFWGVVGWLFERLAELAPAIGLTIAVACAVAAVLCVVALLVAARRLLRHERRWVHWIGVLVVTVAVMASLGFALVAAVAFVAVASFS